MKKKSLILIIIWTIVIIPLISVLINCSDWYKNGANVAWEEEKWEYGYNYYTKIFIKSQYF